MTQDRTKQPNEGAGEKAQATAPLAAPKAAPPAASPDPVFDRLAALGRGLRRWIVRFLFRWVTTAIGLLFVATLFSYLLPGEQMLAAFQDRLKFSVNNINPIALFDYIGNFGVTVWRPVQGVFDAFFSAVGDFIDLVLSVVQDQVSPEVIGLLRFVLILVLFPIIILVAFVMVAGALAVLGLGVLLSPIVLTIAVLKNGNLIEAALVLLIFLPLMWLLARALTGAAAADLNIRERAGLLWLGTWTALGITTLFYAVVNLAILGTGWALGKMIPLAPAGIATSAVVAFCYECTKKALEDTVAEDVVATFKKPEQ